MAERKKVYMSVFIIVIMVLSVFGYVANFYSGGSSNDQTSRYSYNGYEFSRNDNQWEVSVEGEQYNFAFHPLDLNFNIPSRVSEKIDSNDDITLLINPDMDQIQYVELSRFKLQEFLRSRGKNVNSAVVNSSDRYDLPVKKCDSNSSSLSIYFNNSLNSRSSVDGNCINIGGTTSSDYLGFSEKIIYKRLGVI